MTKSSRVYMKRNIGLQLNIKEQQINTYRTVLEGGLHLASKLWLLLSLPNTVITEGQMYCSVAFWFLFEWVGVKFFSIKMSDVECRSFLTCICFMTLSPEMNACVTCVFAVTREQSVTASAS